VGHFLLQGNQIFLDIFKHDSESLARHLAVDEREKDRFEGFTQNP
jgi:hypothetical protein